MPLVRAGGGDRGQAQTESVEVIVQRPRTGEAIAYRGEPKVRGGSVTPDLTSPETLQPDTPRPSHVVWIHEPSQPGPAATSSPPSTALERPLPPAVASQDSDSLPRVVSEQSGVASAQPIGPEVPAGSQFIVDVPAEVAEIVTRDLFDTHGNLELPEKLPRVVPPSPPEPVQARAAESVQTVPQPEELPVVDVFSPGTTVAAGVHVLPSPRWQRTSTLARSHMLSIVGVARLVFWPAKALYWPFRLLTLRWQRSAYQRRYRQLATTDMPATGGSVAVLPANAWGLHVAKLTLQFTAACALLLLPLQIAVYYQDLGDARDRLLARSGAALAALRAGKEELKALRLPSAAGEFQRAQVTFQLAQDEYQRLNFFTKILFKAVPQGRRSVTAGLSLMAAGENLAQLGERFSADLATATQDGGWQNWPALLEALANFQANLTVALPTVAHARTALSGIDLENVPVENREQFLQAASALPELEDVLLQAAALTCAVQQLLGADHWQRYLVVFQNNAELRASGGFLGSYALLDVEDGQVINLEIPAGGSYDLQGGLLALVSSPEPLHLINPRWEFHDGNWWPDFPTSAKKLAWFLEQSRSGSVDGVIALTNTTVERILGLTGPVTLPEYGRTIDATNFTLETQRIVELEYDRTANRPKQFITDLAPRLLERLEHLSADQQRSLLAIFYQALREKQLLMWSRDIQTQQVLTELNWAGQLQPVGLSDYLMVVNSNIAGGKTDRDISTSLRHAVTVQPDGRMTVALTITRTHQGNRGDQFSGVQNNSYIRVYVPAGSSLISAYGFALPDGAIFENAAPGYAYDEDLRQVEGAHQRDRISGMEIYQELGKTVFGHWLSVKPGEQRSATITYQLPFRITEANGAYTLLAQKQPGSLGDELLSTLRLAQVQRIGKTYPPAGSAHLQQADNVVQFHDRLVTDKFYGVVLEKSDN